MACRLLAACLAVALPIGALRAPLVHAHLDEHADHHGANRVHAHLGGHDVNGHNASSEHELAIGPDADPKRIIRLQLFVAVHAAVPVSPALAQPRYALPVPLESIMRRPPAVVHSHGPPGASSTGPRAPPAFPS